MLIDQSGRIATDLRLSLTDRCNLRCRYCLPEANPLWLPREELLTSAEVARLARIAVELLGVRKIRFTGGEPLLRPELVEIVAACAQLHPRPELALTTNAIGLPRRVSALRAAGLDRVNVSLDTVHRTTFAEMTGRDRLPHVLAGIEAAAQAGLRPVKLNAVLLRGVNDHLAGDLLAWAIEHEHELRFIEHMPLDSGRNWRRDTLVTAADIVELLSPRFTLTPDERDRGGDPARRFAVDGGPATVGIIASVTEPFCAACARARLTADGQVRNCLFAREETDLRTPLRGGADDAELARLWRRAMYGKAAGHGIDAPEFRQPARPMSAIGG